MPYSRDKILLCYTANQKLKEARYWLEKMMEKEIFDDDEQFGWHLNSFCTSFASSIDYVHADFVYNKVKPTIKWKQFSRSREYRENIFENHDEKEGIKKFRGEFANKKNILLRDPLMNYFYNKRQEITHKGWSADKQGGFSGEDDDKQYTYRTLEPMFWLFLHEKHPNDLLPQFDEYIPIKEQVETLGLLTSNEFDIKQIGNQVCDKVERFISYFEGKDYFS